MLAICICLCISDEFTCVKVFIASRICVSTKRVCASRYMNFLKSTLSDHVQENFVKLSPFGTSKM